MDLSLEMSGVPIAMSMDENSLKILKPWTRPYPGKKDFVMWPWPGPSLSKPRHSSQSPDLNLPLFWPRFAPRGVASHASVPNICLNIFPAVLALSHEPRKTWACNGNVCAHLVIQVIHILVICDANKSHTQVYICVCMPMFMHNWSM